MIFYLKTKKKYYETVKAIADECKVNRGTVYYWISKGKVELRELSHCTIHYRRDRASSDKVPDAKASDETRRGHASSSSRDKLKRRFSHAA